MSEEDIRQYLSRPRRDPPTQAAPVRAVPVRPRAAMPPTDTFEDFSATHLYCATCGNAMPVKERLVLYLPDGNLYEYRCEGCGAQVGTRRG